jgi:uncharacterized membrane protein
VTAAGAHALLILVPILGQAAQRTPVKAGPKAFPTTLIIGLGAIIVIVLLAGLAVMAMRRRLLVKDSSAATQGRLMDDLRAMRDKGEITPQEYDAARATMAARLAGKPRPAPPPAAPRPTPHASEQTLRAKPGFDLTGARLPSPAALPPGQKPPPSPPSPRPDHK